MIDILKEVEINLGSFLMNPNTKINSMYIDYHKPFVSRIWFQYGECRVYLHKIEPCLDNKYALYHPHPWDSVIRIIKGTYEMGVGHSETNEVPATDCKLFLPKDTIYEMTEKDGWHYVNPIGEPVYSLMITSARNNRAMPIEPNKEFRKLNKDEFLDILYVFEHYYTLRLAKQDIYEFSLR